MLFRLDGPEEDHRAKNILKDALNAQLTLLDGLFPLQGWMIARRRNGEFNVLATHGPWRRNGDLRAVADFTHGQWTAYSEHPGFQYRELVEAEKLGFDELLPASATPDFIIRHPLRNPEGSLQGWLIGVASQKMLGKIVEGTLPAEYVTQAVVGMMLSISLQSELTSVQHKLAELQHNAFVEPLTQVLNRAGWMNRVEHLEAIVARSGEDVAIVMLDLDLLKLVNDVEGHSAGDELLQLTAQTVQSVVRRSDVVGRLGGDEFGVAVRGVNPVLAQSLIKRLRAVLDDVGVNVSIGMAMKSETSNLDEALMLADKRMYEEKRSKPLPDRAMNWQRDAVNKNYEFQIQP